MCALSLVTHGGLALCRWVRALSRARRSSELCLGKRACGPMHCTSAASSRVMCKHLSCAGTSHVCSALVYAVNLCISTMMWLLSTGSMHQEPVLFAERSRSMAWAMAEHLQEDLHCMPEPSIQRQLSVCADHSVRQRRDPSTSAPHASAHARTPTAAKAEAGQHPRTPVMCQAGLLSDMTGTSDWLRSCSGCGSLRVGQLCRGCLVALLQLVLARGLHGQALFRGGAALRQRALLALRQLAEALQLLHRHARLCWCTMRW